MLAIAAYLLDKQATFIRTCVPPPSFQLRLLYTSPLQWHTNAHTLIINTCRSFSNQWALRNIEHCQFQEIVLTFVMVSLYWRISPNRLAHPGLINGPNWGNGYMALLRSGLWVWSKGHLIFCRLLCLSFQISSFLFGPQTIAHILSFTRTRYLPTQKTDASFVRFNCARVECKGLFFIVHSGCAQCVCLLAVLFTLHAASAWHSNVLHTYLFSLWAQLIRGFCLSSMHNSALSLLLPKVNVVACCASFQLHGTVCSESLCDLLASVYLLREADPAPVVGCMVLALTPLEKCKHAGFASSHQGLTPFITTLFFFFFF